MDEVLALLLPCKGRLEQGGLIQYGFEGFFYRGRFYHPNPAAELAAMLDGSRVGGASVRGYTLPVSREGIGLVKRLVRGFDAAIGLGLYTPGTRHIRVEVVAVNALIDDDRVEAVDESRPLYEPASIPVDASAVAEAASRGWEARPSLSTGLYYCNALAYTLYRWSREGGGPSIFLHLPWSTLLAERLGASVEAAPLYALREALEAIIEWLAGG
jgi:pyroglutamyl-peptidase